MSTVQENAVIGIATHADLSDIRFGSAWSGLCLNQQDRIRHHSRLDGANWYVYQLGNLFLLVAEPALAM